jgi:hypothetical protein
VSRFSWYLLVTEVPRRWCLGGRPTPTSRPVRAGDRHLNFYETRDNLATSDSRTNLDGPLRDPRHRPPPTEAHSMTAARPGRPRLNTPGSDSHPMYTGRRAGNDHSSSPGRVSATRDRGRPAAPPSVRHQMDPLLRGQVMTQVRRVSEMSSDGAAAA